jgi:hypothetical protein
MIMIMDHHHRDARMTRNLLADRTLWGSKTRRRVLSRQI